MINNKFYGIEKLSLVDFDGKVACTLFTSGCNFRCAFCHNKDLVINNEYNKLLKKHRCLPVFLCYFVNIFFVSIKIWRISSNCALFIKSRFISASGRGVPSGFLHFVRILRPEFSPNVT
mgnify:CR=1 FL=1